MPIGLYPGPAQQNQRVRRRLQLLELCKAAVDGLGDVVAHHAFPLVRLSALLIRHLDPGVEPVRRFSVASFALVRDPEGPLHPTAFAGPYSRRVNDKQHVVFVS